MWGRYSRETIFQDSKGNAVIIEEHKWFLKSHLLSHKVIAKWAGMSPVGAPLSVP